MRMRFTAIIVAVTLVAGGAAAAPLLNQIDNGGFEAFDDAGDPVEWRVLEGEANPTSDNVEGDKALVLNAVSTTTLSAVAQNVSAERQDAPIVPNGLYDLDFSVLLDTGSGNDATTPPDAEAVVLWKNALGEVSDTDVESIGDTSTYEAHNVTFQAPSDATEAELRFSLSRENPTDRTDANLKVDDVAFGPSGL